jgi:hypothetical protein
MRRSSTLAAAAVLAAGALLPTVALPTAALAGPAATSAVATASPTIEVKLGTQPIRLTTKGQVPLALRIRCSPGVQPFELYVDVAQRAGAGSTSRIAPPFVVTCNGTWERVTVKVAPSVGTFRVGRADVTVSLYAYLPPPEDHDIDVGVGQSVWIGPHK